jgi:hypothetical protein
MGNTSAALPLLVMACSTLYGQHVSSLCPDLVATLSTVPGRLDATVSIERVEIRRCPVDVAKLLGAIQLVAWKTGEIRPSLVFESEDSGLFQLAMMQGVYVFEFMGGRASRIVVISFESGEPRVALDRASRSDPIITSTGGVIRVEIPEAKPRKSQVYEFKRGSPIIGR